MKVISFSYNDDKNLEEQVAYCARVSNPTSQENNLNTHKLLSYLMEHGHWSPFEMVSICLEIETSRDIARQILRHRSFSFQEFSQRYATPSLDFHKREARLQDTKNRQNSIVTQDAELKQKWDEMQSMAALSSHQAYSWAIQHGIAKEQARVVLPEGLTKTRMYMNGTLRSWIHYIQARSGEDTQKEHRDVAIGCARAIEPLFPMIMQFIKTVEK
jgi:thymidylate synthase (FAD)